MGKYRKALIGVAGVVVGLAVGFLDDGTIKGDEWWYLAQGAVTAVGVWFFPNTQKFNASGTRVDNTRPGNW